MPLFLESSTIKNFSDGDFTHRRNFLSKSLTKLRSNNSNSKLNLPEENITSMDQIELKNRLNHALVRQQEIQNELSLGETKLKATIDAVSIVEQIHEIKNNVGGKKDSDPDQLSILTQDLNKVLSKSFNGRALINIDGEDIKGKTPDPGKPHYKQGSLSDISGDSSEHNLSLDMLINLRTQTESHVMQLRRDNNELTIRRSNIQATGSRFNSLEEVKNSLNSVKDNFLFISSDSIRVQANTNLNNTIMYLG